MGEHPVTISEITQLFDDDLPEHQVLWAVFIKRHAGLAVVGNVNEMGLVHAENEEITQNINRSRVYTPIACTCLKTVLYKIGYSPYWSFNAYNLASIRVAQKLGFHRNRPYLTLEFETAVY